MNKISINLAALREIADKGVRRAGLFMGLGVNAARDPSLKQYGLGGVTGFELVPGGADDETLSGYKQEFERWVVGCGLREMMETFGVFLDGAYDVCQLLSEQGKTATEEMIRRIASDGKKFKGHGLKDKLKTLRAGYGVGVKEQTYLISINKARNCLTHRRGIVGIEDCTQGQQLIVSWRGLDFWAETPEGERTPIDLPLTKGFILSVGSKIMAGQSERTKECRLGDVLSFTPKELTEIGITVMEMATEVVQAVEQYGKRLAGC